jgi:phosphatidyl-myo-inositol dimannoside synthase
MTSPSEAVQERGGGVLVVTPSFLPGRGGIETYLARLCAELAPRVAVLAPRRRAGQRLPRDLGYPVVGYPGTMQWPGVDVLRAIVSASESFGTDRVLIGTPWPLVLVGPRLLGAGLRYATVVHGAEVFGPSIVPGVRHGLVHGLLHSDLLLPVSAHTEATLRRVLRPHAPPRIAVLRARIDLQRFTRSADGLIARKRLGLGDGDSLILTLGRLVKRKGVHRLIDAMPYITQLVPNPVLVVAGRGPEERSLRRLAERTRARIVFAGEVTDNEAVELYAAADVFALAVADRWFGLEAEGLGLVLLEASASGTPCVAGASGGTPEAVIDNVTGFVVDARDPGQLVDRIALLLTRPEIRSELGRRAREHATTHFANRELPADFTQWLAGRYDSIPTTIKGAENANPSVGAGKQSRLKRRGPHPKRPREDRPQAKRY